MARHHHERIRIRMEAYRDTIREEILIAFAAEHIQEQLRGDSSGHDWWHVWRVWQTATRIAQIERADPYVTQLAAILHDIADWKFHDGDETAGPRAAAEWLDKHGAPPDLRDRVCEVIAAVTFKGAGVDTPAPSLEAAVVQDADRLDAIGAIGVARAFAYGGSRGRLMYDPETPATPHASFADYKRNAGPTLNHFHEKLLLLKDRMQTATGRKWAERRHAYLENFLQQFLAEWNGVDGAEESKP